MGIFIKKNGQLVPVGLGVSYEKPINLLEKTFICDGIYDATKEYYATTTNGNELLTSTNYIYNAANCFYIKLKTGSDVNTTQYLYYVENASSTKILYVMIENGKLYCKTCTATFNSIASIMPNTDYEIELKRMTEITSQYRLVINGVDDKQNISYLSNSGAFPFVIGKDFVGKLYEVHIYTTSRSGDIENDILDIKPNTEDTLIDTTKEISYQLPDGWATLYRDSGVAGYNPVTVETSMYGLTAKAMFGKELVDVVYDENTIDSYMFDYRFQRDTSINTFSAPNIVNITSYAFRYCFNQNDFIKKVSIPNATSVASYGCSYMCNNASNLEEIDLRNLKTITATYALNYMCYECTNLKRVRLENLTNINSSYALQYAFYNCSNLEEISFPSLTSITQNNAFYYAFRLTSHTDIEDEDSPLEHAFENLTNIGGTTGANSVFYYAFYNRFFYNNGKYSHQFKSLKDIDGTSAFNQAWTYNRSNGAVFDSLETINTRTSNANQTFAQAWQYAEFKYHTDKLVTCCFPKLTQIGKNVSSTNNHSAFKNAWANSNVSAYIDFPSLTDVYNWNSTTTNGHFSTCGAKTIYMPKLVNFGLQNANNFYNESICTEVHFGIENEDEVKAMNGYQTRFGAKSQCSLIFDLENHITVNGVTYNRDAYAGDGYDYDNDWYSWSNGASVVYTKNEYYNAVGDTVYNANKQSIGTISAIS